MVIFSVVSGACIRILIILISNLLTSWFLGALSVFHILTFEMNFCPCTWAFMSHALIGRWTHSTSLRSLLWVHARKANTFTWITFKWTQLQSCTETQSVKDPHLSLHLERGSRQSCLCARRRGCCCLRYTAERSCRRVWEEKSGRRGAVTNLRKDGCELRTERRPLEEWAGGAPTSVESEGGREQWQQSSFTQGRKHV